VNGFVAVHVTVEIQRPHLGITGKLKLAGFVRYLDGFDTGLFGQHITIGHAIVVSAELDLKRLQRRGRIFQI
jgi:hypothetical protein